MWGIFDKQDGLWLGTDTGPLVYDDVDLATVAANVLAVRLRLDATRIEVRPFEDGHELHKRDELTPTMSGLRALQKLELGQVLAPIPRPGPTPGPTPTTPHKRPRRRT